MTRSGLSSSRVKRDSDRETSETDSRAELKGTRAAGAEHLRKARGGLTESRSGGHIATVAGKVRGVVGIQSNPFKP